MNDTKQKAIRATLVWINAVLAFLVAFGVVLGMVLLVCAMILGTEERSGIPATILVIGILFAGTVSGVLAAVKAKMLLTSRSPKTNLIVFLVLLTLFIIFGPVSLTYTNLNI